MPNGPNRWCLKIWPGPSVQLLGDQTEQDRVRVAVLEPLAGNRVRPCAVRDPQQVPGSEHVPRLCVHRPVQRPRLCVVVEAAAHRQQLLDRDVLSVRHVGAEARHRVLEPHGTALGGLEDHGAGERVRDRSDPNVIAGGEIALLAQRAGAVRCRELDAGRAHQHERSGRRQAPRGLREHSADRGLVDPRARTAGGPCRDRAQRVRRDRARPGRQQHPPADRGTIARRD